MEMGAAPSEKCRVTPLRCHAQGCGSPRKAQIWVYLRAPWYVLVFATHQGAILVSILLSHSHMRRFLCSSARSGDDLPDDCLGPPVANGFHPKMEP